MSRAVQLLQQREYDLLNGISSIPNQKKNIREREETLAASRKQLKASKKELLEIREALQLLEAGEED